MQNSTFGTLDVDIALCGSVSRFVVSHVRIDPGVWLFSHQRRVDTDLIGTYVKRCDRIAFV